MGRWRRGPGGGISATGKARRRRRRGAPALPRYRWLPRRCPQRCLSPARTAGSPPAPPGWTPAAGAAGQRGGGSWVCGWVARQESSRHARAARALCPVAELWLASPTSMQNAPHRHHFVQQGRVQHWRDETCAHALDQVRAVLAAADHRRLSGLHRDDLGRKGRGGGAPWSEESVTRGQRQAGNHSASAEARPVACSALAAPTRSRAARQPPACLDVGVLFLQVPPHAGHSAARAHARNEDVHLALCGPPDLNGLRRGTG